MKFTPKQPIRYRQSYHHDWVEAEVIVVTDTAITIRTKDDDVVDLLIASLTRDNIRSRK